MPEMIYHDPLDRTGTSPFDEAIHDIAEGEEISIVCPYIKLEYLEDQSIWLRLYNEMDIPSRTPDWGDRRDIRRQ